MPHFFFSHTDTHTYTREVVHCSVWTPHWFPLHYPAIGQLMLQEAREMEGDRRPIASTFTFHFPHTRTQRRRSSAHTCKYRHIPPGNRRKYIFVFQPINMHMKGEKAVFSAASPKTRPIIAQKPLRCLSELHTCSKHAWLSTTRLYYLIIYSIYHGEKVLYLCAH